MAGNLSHAQGLPDSSGEMERRSDNNATDLRDRDCVDRVCNVRTRSYLQTPFPEANQKVVRNRNSGSRIPSDVSRANNGAHKTSAPSFAHDKLARPLGLPIPCAKTLATALQIVRLQYGGSEPPRELDIVLAIQRRG